MSVAQIIYQQLGGNKFKVMTGSKNFLSSKNKLHMKLSRNSSGANYLTIELTVMDNYTMTFKSIRNTKGKIKDGGWVDGKTTIKTVVEKHGVYCDMLESIFTSVTGLYTRL